MSNTECPDRHEDCHGMHGDDYHATCPVQPELPALKGMLFPDPARPGEGTLYWVPAESVGEVRTAADADRVAIFAEDVMIVPATENYPDAITVWENPGPHGHPEGMFDDNCSWCLTEAAQAKGK